MHELLALVLLTAARSIEEMRSGMALCALTVTLAAANPRCLRQPLVGFTRLTVGLRRMERLVAVNLDCLAYKPLDGLEEAAFLRCDE